MSPALVPTSSFPHPFWPGETELGGSFNRFTHAISEQFMWQPFRTIINGWRQDHLGLKSISIRGPLARMRQSLVLYASSPSVVPRPPEWMDTVQVTGFLVSGCADGTA
jgi:sterol 3beta-glucosyltransferase